MNTNMKYNRFFYVFFGIVALSAVLWQCTDVKDYSPVKDKVAPWPVSNPEVVNLSGGALITYTKPSDPDLLGVKALYSYTDGGEILEAYSSAFTDSIKLEGFPDTLNRIVRLIAIDKSGNESTPVEVSIRPTIPPVELIRRSLKVQTTFQGVTASWENITGANIGVVLYAADSTGTMRLNYTHYSNTLEDIYTFRGFDTTQRAFSVQIRDRWDNYSSTLDTVLTPLFEIQIQGIVNGIEIWQRMGFTYPGNNTSPSSNPECVWRGDAARQNSAGENMKAAMDGSNATFLHLARPGNVLSNYSGNAADEGVHLLPVYLTIDLGRSCLLSRHKLFHRSDTRLGDNNVKEYELWATNNPPKNMSDFADKEASLAYWTSWTEVNGTDAWKNDWTHIASCLTAPPSGATISTSVTSEDKTWANANGFEFSIFPEHTGTPFRYVRIVSQRNWSAGTILHFGEIEFYGAYAD
ncbi:MAG: DUF4959 domain-containing protein [Tannerella sp.]|nr:DUF4959 domain-containing protein [Tannerella sp.]